MFGPVLKGKAGILADGLFDLPVLRDSSAVCNYLSHTQTLFHYCPVMSCFCGMSYSPIYLHVREGAGPYRPKHE
jgi:hypothetical protein